MPATWKFCEEKVVLPMLHFKVRRKKKAEEMGITVWKISITDTKEVATAFVIAVADDVKE